VRVPTLIHVARDVLRTRHYSRRTEKAYIAWIRRYVLFHGKRHPREMGAPEATRFLTALAVDRRVTASTQNQDTVRLITARLATPAERRDYEEGQT
jgi:Phage integrase, N-terminal SAM-like domain